MLSEVENSEVIVRPRSDVIDIQLSTANEKQAQRQVAEGMNNGSAVQMNKSGGKMDLTSLLCYDKSV